jgi:class 3 adenylate cyclase
MVQEESAQGLDRERFNDMLLESTGVGLALLDPESLRIIFHNRRFGEWFASAEVGSGARLEGLLPDLDIEALRKGVAAGTWSINAEVTPGRRPISLALHFTLHDEDDRPLLMLECHNISKIKQLEYMIESYSTMVEKQNRTLERENERVEKLLLNIMPKKVYEELKTFGVTTPKLFESASVLLLDFVGSTEMEISRNPTALIAELNDVFTAFDQIAEQFGIERLRTIGDAYMAVCGVPEPVTDHAQSIAKAALLFLRHVERRNEASSQKWICRIGINTGPVIGSIVGIQKYVYDIFGPGVNLAARMEAASDPMQITFCDNMLPLIRSDFRWEERGEFDVKGFGKRQLYTLLRENTPSVSDPMRGLPS